MHDARRCSFRVRGDAAPATIGTSVDSGDERRGFGSCGEVGVPADMKRVVVSGSLSTLLVSDTVES